MKPSDILNQIKDNWKRQWTIVFFSVILFGLAAHMYKLTNTLPNWDSVQNVYSDQNTIHLGRCFLTFACGISSYYDLPWLNGLLSLIYLGVSAILLCELFEIKNTPVLILTGGLMAAFPTVTSTFAYMYTADGYFLGMLCMTLAIFLTLRTKRGWIPGLFLLGFGYGCYQAYITWAILVVLLWSVLQLLYTKLPMGEILRKWTCAVLCGVCGTVFYLLCNYILLAIQQVELSSYQGISGAVSGSALQPMTAMRQCLVDFAYFFIGPLSRMNFYSYLNIVVLLLIAVFSVQQIVRAKIYRDVKRFLLLCICYAAVPFAAYAIYFISPETNYHMLMMMDMCLVYIYFLLFFDRLSEKGRFALTHWSILLVTGLVVYQFIVIANVSYHTMQRSYNKSYSVVQQMSERIKLLDGAQTCERITVFGQLPGSDEISFNLPPDMTGITEGYIMSTPVHYQCMLAQDWELEYELAEESERLRIAAAKEYQSMPVWPEEGSIVVIEDTIVINLGKETREADVDLK